MDLMTVLGFLSALFIGIVLGLIGGGGSILTLPVLVYLFLINPITATAYSLFIVGVSALVGTLKNIQKGNVDFKTAIVFATPAFIAVYLTRKYMVPALPDILFSINNYKVSKELGIMLFFAMLMLIAGWAMINSNSKLKKARNLKFNTALLLIEGVFTGVLTGLVGAGGGFIIVPALVILVGLSMKKAIATSLLIIAIKSLIGFIGDMEVLDIDWPFLLSFTSLSVIGIFIGTWCNQYINEKPLKKGFGWFVVAMSVFILVKEFTS